MDSVLLPYYSAGAEEREELLSGLIEAHAAPVIRRVLRRKLCLFAGEDADADELYQEAVVRLVARLSAAGRPPLDDLRGYAARVTANVCHSHLRARYPEPAHLKNRVREIVARHPDFTSWRGGPAEIVCGFKEWEGQPCVRPDADPGAIEERVRSGSLRGADLTRLPLARLVAEVFGEAGGPLELDDLASLVAPLRGVTGRPAESVEELGLHESAAARGPSGEEVVAGRELLRLAWAEIRALPRGQRLAVCLTNDGGDADDLPALLVGGGVCTFPGLAASLGLSVVECFALYQARPVNAAVAEHLGVSQAQVNRLRWRGRERLRGRLGLE